MERDYVSAVHTFEQLLKLHERVVALEARVAELSPKINAKPAEIVVPAKPAKKG